eukprot:8353835-Pyramimonas_sp.AAC.1
MSLMRFSSESELDWISFASSCAWEQTGGGSGSILIKVELGNKEIGEAQSSGSRAPALTAYPRRPRMALGCGHGQGGSIGQV